MKNVVLALLLIIVFTILMTMYLNLNLNSLIMSNQYLGFVLFLSFISWVVFLNRKKRTNGVEQYVSITSLFIFSFFVVHFQFYVDYYLGFKADLSLRNYFDAGLMSKAITLSSIALVCFFIGNVLQLSFNKQSLRLTSGREYKFSFLILKFFTFVFFIIFFVSTPADYFNGGYGEMMNNDGIGYLQAKSNHLFQMFLWAYMICVIIDSGRNNEKYNIINYIKLYDIKIIILALLYFVLSILSGDRGPIINITILAFVGYLILSRKKLAFSKIIIFILVGGIFIQFLGYFRETDGHLSFYDRFNEGIALKENIDNRGEKTIIPITEELARSLRSYHAAIMDQETNPPLYGMGNLDDIIAVIPGFGLILNKIFSIKFENTSKYITIIMGTDHGMGTTALADVYLNYREFGVIFLFILFGWIFSKLDYLAYSNFNNLRLATQVSFFVFIVSAFYLGRSSFVLVLSDIVLVYLIIRLSIFCRKKGFS
ncbi:oligosaccharide repeat unit polymerase [Acinetobacter sp. ANC 4945]|uniref:Oligosaccharide repeat unit polymerase n=1 Tax=Acinetobacter amyesii TaxID=2942470 RepID=A0A1T1GQJ7_9GAMM|nr:O-antigen polymerase [Acinetobacter amyesii]MCL6247802.1 oligosaccharide repeat unit polymerase [Acinetobacter amyesii]OOV79848.1 hypothetical protein B1202_15750 [Acinetobacter amyesii]